jgi:hypothetical protein
VVVVCGWSFVVAGLLTSHLSRLLRLLSLLPWLILHVIVVALPVSVKRS